MKSSPNEQSGITLTATAAPEKRVGIFRRFWESLRQIKRDLREPLPDAGQMTRGQRFGARFRFLFKRHGWKLVWSFIVYYLVRDVILYIIIPYLVAKKVWG
jgi:hypothetical protein